MKSKILGALVASAIIMGAGCSTSAPKCSDKETLDLVKEIAMDALVEQLGQDFADAHHSIDPTKWLPQLSLSPPTRRSNSWGSWGTKPRLLG